MYNYLAPEYIAGTQPFPDKKGEVIRSVGLAAMVLLTMIWAGILTLIIGPLKSTLWTGTVTFVLGFLSFVIGTLLNEWSEKNG